MGRFFKRRKKAVVIALAALMIPVGALAYFLATGVGSNNYAAPTVSGAPVDTITITQNGTVGPLLSPGGGADTVNYSVANPNASGVSFTLHASLITDGTGIWDANTSAYNDACKASWFAISQDSTGPFTLAANAADTPEMTVTLSMPANATTDQSACENTRPTISVVAP